MCNYGQLHKSVIFVLSTCWRLLIMPNLKTSKCYEDSVKIFVWKKYQPTYMWIKDNVRKITIMWYNYHLFFVHVLCLQNKPKYCWVLARQIYIGVNWFMKSHSDFHNQIVSYDTELLYWSPLSNWICVLIESDSIETMCLVKLKIEITME